MVWCMMPLQARPSAEGGALHMVWCMAWYDVVCGGSTVRHGLHGKGAATHGMVRAMVWCGAWWLHSHGLLLKGAAENSMVHGMEWCGAWWLHSYGLLLKGDLHMAWCMSWYVGIAWCTVPPQSRPSTAGGAGPGMVHGAWYVTCE
jgi:hypothetical protein